MSCPFAEYKDKLGKPNEGVHSRRFLGLAIFDVVGTIAGAGIIGLIISLIFKYNFLITFLVTLLVLFIIGIFLHRIFCVNTTINKWIFGIV
jgi:hypothetical protein